MDVRLRDAMWHGVISSKEAMAIDHARERGKTGSILLCPPESAAELTRDQAVALAESVKEVTGVAKVLILPPGYKAVEF